MKKKIMLLKPIRTDTEGKSLVRFYCAGGDKREGTFWRGTFMAMLYRKGNRWFPDEKKWPKERPSRE